MKYIITENKLNNVVLRWMNNDFNPNEMEMVKSKKHPDSIFFMKNGEVVIEIEDSTGKYAWFDNNRIWSVLESFFGLDYEQIKGILSYWMEESLKVHGYIPMRKMKFWGLEVE